MAKRLSSIDDMTFPAHTIILGSTISGKSHFLRYIMSRIGKRFKYGVLFSTSVGYNNDYSWMPRKYQHNTFDPKVIRALREHQERWIQYYGQKSLPQCFVVLDDTSGMLSRDRDSFQDLEWCFTTGRHLNISVIALLQNITMLPPTIRQNTRYWFITRANGEGCFKTMASIVKGFTTQELKRFLEKHNCNYAVCAFDTHGVSSSEESRSKITAPPPSRLKRVRLDF